MESSEILGVWQGVIPQSPIESSMGSLLKIAQAERVPAAEALKASSQADFTSRLNSRSTGNCSIGMDL